MRLNKGVDNSNIKIKIFFKKNIFFFWILIFLYWSCPPLGLFRNGYFFSSLYTVTQKLGENQFFISANWLLFLLYTRNCVINLTREWVKGHFENYVKFFYFWATWTLFFPSFYYISTCSTWKGNSINIQWPRKAIESKRKIQTKALF